MTLTITVPVIGDILTVRLDIEQDDPSPVEAVDGLAAKGIKAVSRVWIDRLFR